ncbi:MAG: hypothetical protein NC127_03355 [Muribaculum sp.]|nr:hypothetical protein [Muribaculum sp.]
MKKKALILAIIASAAVGLNAQIGYQVAVMDQATGKPKANKEVSVKVELTDNAGSVIASTEQSAMTNDFGVVSVQVGGSSTFDNMDWRKLPLWVSATVDGVNVGKTQVLTVPVAEHSKHYGLLTPQILAGKWTYTGNGSKQEYSFSASGGYTYTRYEKTESGGWFVDSKASGSYEIDGNMVYMFSSSEATRPMRWSPSRNVLTPADGGGIYTK